MACRWIRWTKLVQLDQNARSFVSSRSNPATENQSPRPVYQSPSTIPGLLLTDLDDEPPIVDQGPSSRSQNDPSLEGQLQIEGEHQLYVDCLTTYQFPNEE